jgi:hypothetical protein
MIIEADPRAVAQYAALEYPYLKEGVTDFVWFATPTTCQTLSLWRRLDMDRL